jgi:chemotaxis signal transduction protein
LLEGVVNVRGELHLLASLPRLLQLSETPTPSNKARLIVIGRATEPWVIRADEITNVIHVSDDALEAPPSSLPTALHRYIDAVTWVQERHVYLLNAERVIEAFVQAQY